MRPAVLRRIDRAARWQLGLGRSVGPKKSRVLRTIVVELLDQLHQVHRRTSVHVRRRCRAQARTVEDARRRAEPDGVNRSEGDDLPVPSELLILRFDCAGEGLHYGGLEFPEPFQSGSLHLWTPTAVRPADGRPGDRPLLARLARPRRVRECTSSSRSWVQASMGHSREVPTRAKRRQSDLPGIGGVSLSGPARYSVPGWVGSPWQSGGCLPRPWQSVRSPRHGRNLWGSPSPSRKRHPRSAAATWSRRRSEIRGDSDCSSVVCGFESHPGALLTCGNRPSVTATDRPLGKIWARPVLASSRRVKQIPAEPTLASWGAHVLCTIGEVSASGA